MKINQIKIYGFGKFHDLTLDLNEQLTLLYGPNETGKSTLVEFITSVLFGFRTAKHKYQMYKPKNGANYGGELTFKHGETNYLVKRVAGKNGGAVTFRDLTNDVELEPTALEEILQPVNRELFRQIFCFDETDLTEVIHLDRFELTNRIQRIGAVGSDNWIKLNKKLHKAADELFKPRGRVQPMAKALEEHQKLEQKIQAAKAAYPKYLATVDQVKEVTATLKAAETKTAASLKQLNQLTRLGTIYESYQKYRDFQALEDSSKVTVFPTEDWQLYTSLTTEKQQLTTRKNQAQKEVASQRETHQATPEQQFYLDHQTTLDAQISKLDDFEQAVRKENELTTVLVKLQAQQTALDDKYHQALPLTDHDLPIVQDLLTTQQKTEVQLAENTRQQTAVAEQLAGLKTTTAPAFRISMKWLLAGIAILAGGFLFFDGAARVIGGLLGIGVAAYGLMKSRLQSTSKNQNTIDYLQKQQKPLQEEAAELKNQLDQLAQKLTEFEIQYHLESIEQDKWLAVQPELKELMNTRTSVNETKTTLDEVSNQLKQFSQEWQTAAEPLGLAQQPSERLNQVKQFANARMDESQRLRLANESLQKAESQLTALTQQLAKVTQEVTDFLEKRHVPDEAAFERAYEAGQKASNQKHQAQAVKEQLTEEDLAALSKYPDKTGLQEAIDSAEQSYNQDKEQSNQLLEQKTATDWTLKQASENSDYQGLIQQQATLEAEITAMADEWLANQLLIRWIDQTLINASKGRQPEILTNATSFFKVLTDDRYQTITFTDETVEVTRNDGTVFEVGELSKGTAEQLYVALRFAFTKVMAAEIQMPVILDDAFVNFDRQRIQNAFKLLNELQATTQILYFTADETNTTLVDQRRCLDLKTVVQ